MLLGLAMKTRQTMTISSPPALEASREELAAIRRGRGQIRCGKYITLEKLRDGLAISDRKAGPKRDRKAVG
jgi:hypothetical protein